MNNKQLFVVICFAGIVLSFALVALFSGSASANGSETTANVVAESTCQRAIDGTCPGKGACDGSGDGSGAQSGDGSGSCGGDCDGSCGKANAVEEEHTCPKAAAGTCPKANGGSGSCQH